MSEARSISLGGGEAAGKIGAYAVESFFVWRFFFPNRDTNPSRAFKTITNFFNENPTLTNEVELVIFIVASIEIIH